MLTVYRTVSKPFWFIHVVAVCACRQCACSSGTLTYPVRQSQLLLYVHVTSVAKSVIFRKKKLKTVWTSRLRLYAESSTFRYLKTTIRDMVKSA